MNEKLLSLNETFNPKFSILRKFVLTSHEGFILSDVVTHRSLPLNHCIFTELGYEFSELEIDPFNIKAKLLNEDDLTRFEKFIDLMLLDTLGNTADCEVRFKCKNGSEKWIALRSTVLERSEHGKPTKFLSGFRNIDESKLLSECRKMNVNLKNDRQFVLQFLDETSKTTGYSITSMQSIVDGILDEKKHEYKEQKVELLKRQLKHLQGTITTQLHFCEFESGKMKAVFQPTDLALFTYKVASVYEDVINAGGIKFKVKCENHNGAIYVCRDMWEKVISSLILNAFNHTSEGQIRVTLRFNKKHVQFKVSDSSGGLSSSEVDNIFERSANVGQTRRSTKADGLSLYFVRQIIGLHGGTIRARSYIGKGSEFAVSLPYGKSHLPIRQIHEFKTLN